MPLSGVLADQVGWEAIFYVFGALGIVWALAWFFLVFDAPAAHPRISKVGSSE